MAKSKGNALVSLADKPGPLKREDIMCPICWSVLMQPVGLPCKHNLCLDCFKKHVEETSLQCPCCRMRLSVWSRRAFRENNLVDTKLWERIQREFPKLVQTRMCGEDSQDLLPEDLISVNDRNRRFVEIQPSPEKESPSKCFVRDGEFNSANGDIRRELESTLRKHQEDIENKRRMEETASVDLIRQLQEEEMSETMNESSVVEVDLQLAQKLQEDEKNARLAEITARRKLFTEPEPSSAKKTSSVGTKLISDWASCTPPNCSAKTKCNGVITPKTSGKRPSLSSLSSRSAKKTKKTKRSESFTKNSARRKSFSQEYSQNSILSYLAPSSQNSPDQLDPNEDWVISFSPQPSTSAEAISRGRRRSDMDVPRSSPLMAHSAFSPTKSAHPSRSLVIPGRTIYTTVPKVINRFLQFSQSFSQDSDEDCPERDSSPNSIDLEVNCHFRPIRSAPKTPPKRLPSGKFVPEPRLIKTTPMKVIPLPLGTPAVSASITVDPALSEGKPSKIEFEDGKRVSDDSGRASVSSMGSGSNSVEILFDSCCEAALANAGSPVTNQTVTETGGNQNDSGEESINIEGPPAASVKVTNIKTELVTPSKPSPPPSTSAAYSSPRTSTADLPPQKETVGDPDVDFVDSQTLELEEETADSPESNEDPLGLDLMAAEQEAELERIRLKRLQEEEDLRMAQKLQRELNRPSPVKKRYGLRSWLKTADQGVNTRSSN